MKTIVASFLLMTSLSSYADNCQLVLSSNESGKIMWAEGYKEKHTGVSLEDCVARLESLLGTQAKFQKTLVRPSVNRLITGGRYQYQNARMMISGTGSLKDF